MNKLQKKLMEIKNMEELLPEKRKALKKLMEEYEDSDLKEEVKAYYDLLTPKAGNVFDEIDFEEKYTFNESVKSEVFSSDDGQGGMLETYGDDYEKAKQISKKYPKKIWSAVDNQIGFCFVPGLKENAVYFFVTKQNWKDDNDIYVVKFYGQE